MLCQIQCDFTGAEIHLNVCIENYSKYFLVNIFWLIGFQE